MILKRSVVGYAAAAAAAWFLAGLFAFETDVEIDIWNGQVRWTVAQTSIVARIGPIDVDRLDITTRPGIFPTGAFRLEAANAEGPLRSWPLPNRFRSAQDARPATGDWWVDEVLAEDQVFSAPIDLGPEFTLRTTFRGRFHQYLVITLDGPAGVRCSFRRGWLNNDLFIEDGEGSVLSSGSIDPRPVARLAATGATLLRAIAGACLLIALWSAFAGPQLLRDESAEPRSNHVALGTLIAFALLAAAGSWLTATDILDRVPHLPDEVVYRLQAHWLLDGRITGDVPPCPDRSRIPLTYFEDDRWIGHYHPAWPSLLAPGFALGTPWLIPTLLRSVNVLLVGLLALRMGGRWTAVAAAALAATSPLATLLFATWMPHSGSSTAALAALLLCLPENRVTSSTRWVAVGLLLAAAFAFRPLTAVAVALPLGCFLTAEIIERRRRMRDLLLVTGAGLLATCSTLVVNAALTGSPWQFPYSLASGTMMGPENFAFGLRNLDVLTASLGPLLHGWGWPWLPGPILLALPLAPAAIPFLARRATREDRLLLAVAIILPFAHIWVRASGFHGYGPRYLFTAGCLLWVLTARGFAELASQESRRLPAAAVIFALLVCSTLATLPTRLGLYRGYNDVDGSLSQAVSELPTCSLVLIPPGDWRGWVAATPWQDRSDPSVVVIAADSDQALDLESCIPDRHHYRWNGEILTPTR